MALFGASPALIWAQTAPARHPLLSKSKPTGGEYDEWVQMGEAVRTFRVHLPPKYNHMVPLPLLIVLHDEGGDARSMATTARLNEEADKAEFIVAYPNGTGEPASWNAGHCCGAARAAKSPDVTFLEALIDLLTQSLKVDDKRIGLIGLGNGGMLAYAATLQLSPKVASVAVVAGSLGVGPGGGPMLALPSVISPFSLIVLHAKDDPVVPLTGGAGPGEPRIEHMAARDTVTYLARLNGCQAVPVTDETSTEAVTIEHFNGCADAADVMLYTIAQGGHGWPLVRFPGDLSTAGLLLEFVVRHPKP